MEFKNSPDFLVAMSEAYNLAISTRQEFITPEHFLAALCEQDNFALAFYDCSSEEITSMKDEIFAHFETLEKIPQGRKKIPVPDISAQFSSILDYAIRIMHSSGCDELGIPHIVKSMFDAGEESWASYFLHKYIDDEADFLSVLTGFYGSGRQTFEPIDELEEDNEEIGNPSSRGGSAEPWRKLVTCITDQLRDDPACHNPLIGREAELDRTIQVLCRFEKNNPLHVGEPGVGKTALVYGLAQRILDGDVPERLQGAKIYSLEMGSLIAGTQFRGDFEKRIKQVMDGIAKDGNAIVYIDEIHNLIGAGRTEGGSMDASNMLKPYFEKGDIRFIGATTYDEYNRYFSKSAGIVRRFQQIDILEPSVEETVKILEGLRKRYEQFHHVKYAKGVMEHAVKMAARYINDRFLPDKAIDLIDEAGAFVEAAPYIDTPDVVNSNTVSKDLINDVLARICKVETLSSDEDETEKLEDLEARIKSRIYGQDFAVKQVVEAVQMSKAGLMEEDKPIASFLFVGPTGVGKTEVARVLAKELGVELIRYDMSEYAEKHAVAKLIGSPAGYVGYEDGGLLTDAVRKTPHCVLLFDEIEKAPPDIFNIFLQMMDYARLTDNRGRKTDFRHCVIIMTSNAGAQFASQASVGFNGNVSAGEAMLRQVKKTFKPEFIARLSATVVFRDMDEVMAKMILDKKLSEFSVRLATRKVEMELAPAAYALLLKQGFTRETGAREMDRVIAQHLKPLFTRAILFGKLKKGGSAFVDYVDDQFTLTKKTRKKTTR